MTKDVIANMQGRIDLCRRPAKSTHDAHAAKIISEMADQIEADIRRLESSNNETDTQMR
jgi:hypothetical protein